MKLSLKSGFFYFVMMILCFYSCSNTPDYILSESFSQIDKHREAKILSAFFGLDDALPKSTIGPSPKAPNKDGMTIVFLHELKKKGIPISVSLQAYTAIDPRDDANDFIQNEIVRRW